MTSVEKLASITDDDHKKFMSLIDPKCKILNSAVARLYLTKGGVNDWIYSNTGLIALMKDNPRKNYYLQLFNMDDLCKCWELVISRNFCYQNHQKQISTFDTGDGPALISFAFPNEGSVFSATVQQLIQQRKEKSVQKEQRKIQENNGPSSYQSVTRNYEQQSVTKVDKKPIRDAKGRLKISKQDISTPTNFRHVDHMGLNECFFDNPNDANLKKFLKEVNMEGMLNNEQNKQEIYDFIDQHGGVDRFMQEMNQKENKTRRAPDPPQKHPPPPPPERPINMYVTPTIVAPKPIHTSYHPQAPPPPLPPQPSTNITCAPPPPGGPPAPPPPPPPPAPMSVPLPPSMPKPAPQNQSPSPVVSGKDDLLSAIQRFDKNNLKTGTVRDAKESKVDEPVESAGGGTLLESLAAYLKNRENIMQANSSDESSDSDEEWND